MAVTFKLSQAPGRQILTLSRAPSHYTKQFPSQMIFFYYYQYIKKNARSR